MRYKRAYRVFHDTGLLMRGVFMKASVARNQVVVHSLSTAPLQVRLVYSFDGLAGSLWSSFSAVGTR